MDWRISAFTLLCLVISGVGAINVVIPKEEYEYARGDNVTLPCTFQTKGNPKEGVFTWYAEGIEPNPKEDLILTHFAYAKRTDVTQKYEGRVTIDVDPAKGQANLKLSSITLADNKIFQCRAQIPGDDEGTGADKARLMVLVAPSTPICKVVGKQEYGQNVNLTCVSEEGSPPPTYKWESRDVKNLLRMPDPRTTTIKGGLLSLYNISRDTSGYYICTSTNKIRSASCNITLTVMPPSMNIGSTAGIIGGVVAALIVLIIVIYCCCCRKKKKDEEYAMGVREEEYHDKETPRNGESRRADGQEDESGYDDSSVRRPAERSDRYEEHSERSYNPRSDYDDRRSNYDDRRSDYSDHRDRHERYDDERRYDDRRDRRHDDDHYDDRYDEPYDDRERGRPPVPNNKPPRRDYDDD